MEETTDNDLQNHAIPRGTKKKKHTNVYFTHQKTRFEISSDIPTSHRLDDFSKRQESNWNFQNKQKQNRGYRCSVQVIR